MADVTEVKARVNAAREACSLPALEELPAGERGNPCFCPIGRALRKDMGEAFFLAVATKHVRLASTDGNVKEIARRIRDAWGIGEDKSPSPVGEEFLTVPLPAEMREFVAEFDAGKLPELEGEIEQSEKVRFNDLAKRLWKVTVDRLRRVRRWNRGQAREPKPGL
jgi:hypothetical protein